MSAEKQYRTIPNRWVSMQLDATTQLTYVPLINPAPLTASIPGNDPVLGALEIVITNQSGDTLEVSQIDFNIQVGSGASLTPSTTSVLYAISDTATWSISGPSSPVTDGIATYSVTPTQGLSAPLANGAALVVLIYDFQTNTTPGTSTIGIQETIGSDVNDSSFQVTTFPSSFFFDSLTVTILQGSDFVAVAQVPFNTNVDLFWNASVVDPGSVKILQSTVNGQQTFTPTIVNEWTTPSPIQTDTIFTVQITTTATPGGIPLVAALSTSVAVQTPVLVASTLTVNGASTLTGNVNAGAVTAPTLNISGAAVAGTVSAGEISAGVYNAGSIATGTISTTGNATLASASVTGTVSAGEVSASNISTGSINVTGNATLSGGLSVPSGPVSMLGAGTMLASGTNVDLTWITAYTDGFAISQILTPGGSYNSKMSYAYGYIFTAGTWFQNQGGTVGSFGPSWDDYMDFNPNCMCIPIAANSRWGYSASNVSNNQMDSPIQIWWFPLGGAQSVEDTYRIISAEEAGDMPDPPTPPTPATAEEYRRHKTSAASAFIESLAEMLHTPLSTEEKLKLSALLAHL